METASTSKVSLDRHRKLEVYEWGREDAPRVLLVHGLSSRASQLSIYVEPLVAAGFNVLAFDAPAHGHSDGDTMSLPEYASAIETVERQMGPFHSCLAHSKGAAAMTIALSRGVNAKRVVYIAPPENFSQYLKRLGGLIGFSELVCELAQQRLEAQFGSAFDSVRGTTLAKNMSMPALIFHDEDDRMVPFSEGLGLSESWPNAALIRTQGMGHNRILRQEDVILRALKFIAGPQNNYERLVVAKQNQVA